MSLREDRFSDPSHRNPTMPLRPVLGATTSRKDSLAIRKNCGSDNVCVPDLHLRVKPNVDDYILGSKDFLKFDVLVENRGEDAFEAMYNLKVPAGIDFVKIDRIDGKKDIPVQCSPPKPVNNNTLRCDIGNPLPHDQLVHFSVLLEPRKSHSMRPLYEFLSNVTTTNPEDASTTRDNFRQTDVKINILASLEVIGESKPKEVYYNPENYTSEKIVTDVEFGPAFIHNYTIKNLGPSEVLQTEVILQWPARTLAGDEYVYLLEVPEHSPSIVCQGANYNYLGYQVS